MCLLILEIIFLIAGLWLLITGKIPDKFFSILFGKGKYVLNGLKTRLFGLLLGSPIPVVVSASLFLGIFFGDKSIDYARIFEIAYNVVVIIAAILIARNIRQPEVPLVQSSSNQNNPQ
jgi:hypothetical protein